jgi:hypothetical protein
MRDNTWSNDHEIKFLNSHRVIVEKKEYKWTLFGERKIGIKKTENA